MGILSCRFWCLPARRYTSAGAGQVHAPWPLKKRCVFPLKVSWKVTLESYLDIRNILPGVLVSLGMRQRTKWGWVLLKLVISLFKFSYKTIWKVLKIISSCIYIRVPPFQWSVVNVLLFHILMRCLNEEQIIITKINHIYGT